MHPFYFKSNQNRCINIKENLFIEDVSGRVCEMLIPLNEGRYWCPSLYFMDNIFDWALAIEFLDGCPLFYKTPVSYLPLICQDRSMQTLELPIHTMSSVCPPSWCNPTLKSEPPKINKWNPNQKCYSPLDGCQRGRMIRPDLILFPNHMMHSDN